MQFIGFENKDGNPKGVAVFTQGDQYTHKLDQQNLQRRIANLKQNYPNIDLSCEIAALAEMKRTDGDNP